MCITIILDYESPHFSFCFLYNDDDSFLFTKINYIFLKNKIWDKITIVVLKHNGF